MDRPTARPRADLAAAGVRGERPRGRRAHAGRKALRAALAGAVRRGAGERDGAASGRHRRRDRRGRRPARRVSRTRRRCGSRSARRPRCRCSPGPPVELRRPAAVRRRPVGGDPVPRGARTATQTHVLVLRSRRAGETAQAAGAARRPAHRPGCSAAARTRGRGGVPHARGPRGRGRSAARAPRRRPVPAPARAVGPARAGLAGPRPAGARRRASSPPGSRPGGPGPTRRWAARNTSRTPFGEDARHEPSPRLEPVCAHARGRRVLRRAVDHRRRHGLGRDPPAGRRAAERGRCRERARRRVAGRLRGRRRAGRLAPAAQPDRLAARRHPRGADDDLRRRVLLLPRRAQPSGRSGRPRWPPSPR